MKKAFLNDPYICLKFKGEGILDKIKKLDGRRWIPEKKLWIAPPTFFNLIDLKSFGFLFDKKLGSIYRKILPKDSNKIILPKLNPKLMRYQIDGIKFIESRNGRALIADVMGLGKTAQALSWLSIHPELRPVIIIVPANVKLNWEKECFLWMKKPKIEILYGEKPYRIRKKDIYIINYDILDKWVPALKKINPKVIILDEIHYIKSKSAKRTKATTTLSDKIDHIIGLSGTPIVNKPIEAFSAIQLINPKLFTEIDFKFKYCGPKKVYIGRKGYRWEFNGANNTKELHKRLTSSIMIRRTKEELKGELPPKMFSVVPISYNRKEYQKAEKDISSWVKNNKGNKNFKLNSFTKMSELRQLTTKLKLPEVIEWLKDVLENDSGKTIIFCWHHLAVDALYSKFKNISVKITGKENTFQKKESEDKFNNDKNIKFLIGTIKAAGVGLNLTIADKVVFVELPWTSTDLEQAEDRAHRKGQINTVNIYYLIAPSTIDEYMIDLLESKRSIISEIVDGNSDLEEDKLINLLLDTIIRRNK